MKLIYLVIQNISKKWTMPMWNWGLTMTQLHIKFGDRLKAFGDFFLGGGWRSLHQGRSDVRQFTLHSRLNRLKPYMNNYIGSSFNSFFCTRQFGRNLSIKIIKFLLWFLSSKWTNSWTTMYSIQAIGFFASSTLNHSIRFSILQLPHFVFITLTPKWTSVMFISLA